MNTQMVWLMDEPIPLPLYSINLEISTNMTAMIARTSSCHCGSSPQ